MKSILGIFFLLNYCIAFSQNNMDKSIEITIELNERQGKLYYELENISNENIYIYDDFFHGIFFLKLVRSEENNIKNRMCKSINITPEQVIETKKRKLKKIKPGKEINGLINFDECMYGTYNGAIEAYIQLSYTFFPFDKESFYAKKMLQGTVMSNRIKVSKKDNVPFIKWW